MVRTDIGRAAASVLVALVAGCGVHYPPPGPFEPGYVIAGAKAREAYGIADTVREVAWNAVPRRVLSAAAEAASSMGLDPYCTRFFASSDLTVVMTRAWCDLPNVTLSDNAIEYRVYRNGTGWAGPPLADWRAWFPTVAPAWQPPLDSARARKTKLQRRG